MQVMQDFVRIKMKSSFFNHVNNEMILHLLSSLGFHNGTLLVFSFLSFYYYLICLLLHAIYRHAQSYISFCFTPFLGQSL